MYRERDRQTGDESTGSCGTFRVLVGTFSSTGGVWLTRRTTGLNCARDVKTTALFACVKSEFGGTRASGKPLRKMPERVMVLEGFPLCSEVSENSINCAHNCFTPLQSASVHQPSPRICRQSPLPGAQSYRCKLIRQAEMPRSPRLVGLHAEAASSTRLRIAVANCVSGE